jgi:hypothetical protein
VSRDSGGTTLANLETRVLAVIFMVNVYYEAIAGAWTSMGGNEEGSAETGIAKSSTDLYVVNEKRLREAFQYNSVYGCLY